MRKRRSLVATTSRSSLRTQLAGYPEEPRSADGTEWTIPAFAFPAEAGTYLPTPDIWKAELAPYSRQSRA